MVKIKRKAFLGDGILIIILFFVLALSVISGWIALSSLNSKWQNETNIPQESKDILGKFSNRYVSVFDWFIGFIFFGLIIGLLLSAYLLRVSPPLGAIAILILFIIVGITMRLSNSYRSFISADNIQEYSSSFSLTNIIMDNLPKFILFILVLFIIILFSTGRGEAI